MNHFVKKTLLCTILTGAYVIGNVFGVQVPVSNTILSSKPLVGNEQNNTDTSNTSDTDTVTTVKTAKSALEFTDMTPEDWFFPYVDILAKQGVINGTTSTTFSPKGTFSVAECCVVITRYLGLEQQASQKQAELISKNKKGCNLWYAGYVQLMYEAGVLNVDGLSPDNDGLLNLTSSICERPIKRYEFSNCIANSFDLSQSGIRAQNIYDEVGGLGHEFICGGAYDNTALNTYPLLINDFGNIPEDSRKNVLKCYYNGIFNGDNAGNFNPQNNLSRGEMAKVLAVVTNYSLRTRTLTPNAKNILLTDSNYIEDAHGNKRLSTSTCQQILNQEANGIYANNGKLTYSNEYTAPLGYAIDVYVYSKDQGGKCKLIAQSSLSDSNPNEQEQINCNYGNNGKALLVLRDLTKQGEALGTLELALTYSGIQSYSDCTRLP